MSRGRPHEEIVCANGVDLCVESFGDRNDPAIMLVGGASSSMDWWEEEFCERLASGPRFVIRYDYRDTGRSVTYEPGAPRYTVADLVADAVGVLDVLALPQAHLVGLSMGGAIAQLAALDYPERVTSLTLIASSPVGAGDDLPGLSEEAAAAFAVSEPRWSDRASVVDYIVHHERACASPARPFDDAGFRELAGRVFDRTINIESSVTNHHLLEEDDGWRKRLRDIEVPTLVVHGTDDPLHTYEHGTTLTREIRGATLLTLEDTGHELPARTWDVVVPAILNITSGRRHR